MSSFYKKKDMNIHSDGVDNLGRKHSSGPYRGSNLRLVKRDGTKEYNKWTENNHKTLSAAMLEKERLETKYKCRFIIVEKNLVKVIVFFQIQTIKIIKKYLLTTNIHQIKNSMCLIKIFTLAK